jgi:hypothetical protein
LILAAGHEFTNKIADIKSKRLRGGHIHDISRYMLALYKRLVIIVAADSRRPGRRVSLEDFHSALSLRAQGLVVLVSCQGPEGPAAHERARKGSGELDAALLAALAELLQPCERCRACSSAGRAAA